MYDTPLRSCFNMICIFEISRTALSMSWAKWIFILWSCTAPSLLLVGLVGRQLGLQVGVQVVQTVTCSRWGTPGDQGLFEDGDVIIGGLFNLHYNPPAINYDFTQQPYNNTCTG